MKTLEQTKLKNNWKKLLQYREQRVLGIKIGYKCLDDYLLGLGNTVCIQGDTGCNKSTLAAQIIRYNCKQGVPCILVDKENGEGRIQSRILCQENHISETEVKVASLEKLKQYRKAVYDIPLHIHTEQIEKSDILYQRVEELFETYGQESKALLVIDSFQALDKIAKDERISLESWAYFFDVMKLKFGGRLTIISVSEKTKSSYGSEELGAGKGTNSVDYKNETILNISETADGRLAVKVIKQRDGVKGAKFYFERELMDKENPRSFTFNLKEEENATL